MSLSIGQKAPDFTLPDQDKKMWSLADFKGKNIVLFFFPGAWTGVCTKEMCTIQENYNDYASVGAVPVGISVDSIFALKRFKEDYKLNDLLLLSDFNKDAIKAYDIVFNGFAGVGANGVAKRSTFVIDKDGIIRFMEVLATPGEFPSMDKIKQAVEELTEEKV